MIGRRVTELGDRLPVEQGLGVAAHDRPLVRIIQRVEQFLKVGGRSETFGMGEVGTHHQAAGVTSKVSHDARYVILGIGGDADKSLEQRAWTLVEPAADPGAAAAHTPALVHVPEHVRNPTGAVLGDKHTQVVEPTEQRDSEGRSLGLSCGH